VRNGHPDDYWINRLLVEVSWGSKPDRERARRVEEALPYLRVSVALRPESAVDHYNLALALYDKHDLDGAIAECRMAVELKRDYAEAYTEGPGGLGPPSR
jgi:tetratricopeptide (TPR) repeat protein